MIYKQKNKRERNERLFKYHKEHPDITLRSLAKIFRISAPRVHQILKSFDGSNDN